MFLSLGSPLTSFGLLLLGAVASAPAFAAAESGPVCWNNPKATAQMIPGAATGMFVRQELKPKLDAGEMCVVIPPIDEYFRKQCRGALRAPYFYWNLDLPKSIAKIEGGLTLKTFDDDGRDVIDLRPTNPRAYTDEQGRRCVDLIGPLKMTPYLRVYDRDAPWASMTDRWQHLRKNTDQVFSPGDRVCFRLSLNAKDGAVEFHAARREPGQPMPVFDGQKPLLMDPTPENRVNYPEIGGRFSKLLKQHAPNAVLRRTVGLAHSVARFWETDPLSAPLRVDFSQSRARRATDGKWLLSDSQVVHQAPAPKSCWTTRWPIPYVRFQTSSQTQTGQNSGFTEFLAKPQN